MVQKGVDFIGWRMCPQQKEWGPKRFALTIKKIGRQAAEIRGVQPPTANARTPEQRRQLQLYQEATQGAAIYAKGIPECKDCELSGGKAYGCHAMVNYPIDSTAERALFDFFANNMQDDNHICTSLYRDIIGKVPPKGTPWHTDRGPAGSLAELDSALVKEWGFLMWKKRIDSAQILGSLFFTQTKTVLLNAFGKFWEQFIDWARNNTEFDGSPTLQQFALLQEFYDRVGNMASTAEGVYVLVEDDAPSSHKGSMAPPPS
jgi:hypothetical protein